MSLFVSFEGGEGSGKTTQVAILLRRLEQIGHSTVSTARAWDDAARPRRARMAQAQSVRRKSLSPRGRSSCCSRPPGRRWSPSY